MISNSGQVAQGGLDVERGLSVLVEDSYEDDW